ncbi:hypothetical protein [Streptomyces sp. NPDC101165]|uniref:hypothetical protein n=1 Tax=Streptomyces sp. NPDC101165 TaxID=3366119 RepID=UPI00382ED9D2
MVFDLLLPLAAVVLIGIEGLVQGGPDVVQVPVQLLMELVGREPDGALSQGEQVRSALAQGVDSHALIPAQLFSGLGVVAVVGISYEACIVVVREASEVGSHSKSDYDRNCGQQKDDSGK